MMELDNIYNEDCLQGMRRMEAESVDLTVTSPPYDNLRTYNGYCFDFENLAKGLYRVLKQGGVVVWIVNDATVNGSETGTSFKQALYFMECGFKLHDTMIWAKDGGGALGSNRCYTQNFEYMFILSKGTPKAYNLICDKKNLSYGQDKSGVGRRNPDGSLKIEKRKEASAYSKRNNWWLVVPGTEEGSSFHPAVFPEKLVRDHIWTWSNEGDLVYDPFMGSGTTGKMAVNLKRHYIGSEISSEYVEKARKRVWAEEAQLTLF